MQLCWYVAQGENGPLVEELRLQLAVKEKELQVMKDGAEELKLLQQQNYVLQSKVQGRDQMLLCALFLTLLPLLLIFFLHFILNLGV